MNTQYILVSALSYLLKYQESGCAMAGERVVLMLEAIIDNPDIAPELKELCGNTIDSIEARISRNKAIDTGPAAFRACAGVGIPLYADLSLR